MRYDTKVWFCKTGEKIYDESTGNYIQPEEKCVAKFCSVTDAIDNLSRTPNDTFGQIPEDGKIIRVNEILDEYYDYVRIGETRSGEFNRKYHIDLIRTLRNRQIYTVHEVR